MKYLGGKVRVAKHIVAHLNEATAGGASYWEPFVGGGSIVAKVVADRRVASDACLPLINMYRALKEGWVPPEVLDEAEYVEIKKTQDPNDPLTAFAGFACSYAGKWFGGYARDGKGKRNYAGEGKRALLKWLEEIRDVEFYYCHYQHANIPSGWVIYCDPPYAGTTSYSAVHAFDHERFWRWVRILLEFENQVFVSEYTAPEWAVCVDQFERNLEMSRRGGERRTERLFRIASD